MKTEPLEFHHKELLTARFQALSLCISEYSFANLYLFRKLHQTEIVIDFDIFIKGKTRDGFTFLMPTAPVDSMDHNKLFEITCGVDFLFPIPENWVSSFDRKRFVYDFNEDDSDYVYETGKFRAYPGRHLAGRRNLVKQFMSEHETNSFPLTEDRKADAQSILERWMENVREKLEVKGDNEADFEACSEAIRLLDELGLQGRIYYDGIKPVGFIIGESLSKNMFVEHFSKSSVFDTGVYQYMYQQFALDLDDHFYYVNMEQDLGDIGLKRSKKAYMPDFLVNKFRIKAKSRT